MLRTENKLYKAILIICLVAIVAGVVLGIWGFTNAEASLLLKFSGVFTCLALLFAWYYIQLGYRKNAASYLKIYEALVAVGRLRAVGSVLGAKGSTAGVIVTAVTAALTLFLMLCKDLGKAISFALVFVIIICTVVELICGIAADVSSALAPAVISRCVSSVIMAILLFVMIFAKYLDKKERGAE